MIHPLSRRFQRLVVFGVIATIMQAPAQAGLYDASHASSSAVQIDEPIRKLGRGLANAVGGVLEIPVTITCINDAEGPVAGASLGLLYGLANAVTRTLIGVAEVATFPFPLPDVGYGPIIKPEFLLSPLNAPDTPTSVSPSGRSSSTIEPFQLLPEPHPLAQTAPAEATADRVADHAALAAKDLCAGESWEAVVYRAKQLIALQEGDSSAAPCDVHRGWVF